MGEIIKQWTDIVVAAMAVAAFIDGQLPTL